MRKLMKAKMKRLSVSLAEDDYTDLANLAKEADPQIPIQFIANHAIKEFLKDKKGCKFVPRWEPPEKKEKTNET